MAYSSKQYCGSLQWIGLNSLDNYSRSKLPLYFTRNQQSASLPSLVAASPRPVGNGPARGGRSGPREGGNGNREGGRGGSAPFRGANREREGGFNQGGFPSPRLNEEGGREDRRREPRAPRGGGRGGGAGRGEEGGVPRKREFDRRSAAGRG
jgi:hypothetical protein